MSPLDTRVAMLLDELRRDWGAVESSLERARSTDSAESAPAAAYVALALDHAYQAFESMLVRIERALALPERSRQAN